MDQKTTMEKLRILLPHWIEHNHNHEAEFKKWVELVGSEGHAVLADLLAKAVVSMAETDTILKKVLAEIGGPGEGHHHGHHHHQHYD
ncbi:MAG: hypothetical protein CVU58_07590 [Deltaproteobacteria bacterium HGW-Deltaproteobacteria-16]|nr:MAG: hypothetical protein CVU58_07590 [Deltaproteobacteria bacterium HGW-Deltaproteobacteria-16]